MAVGMFRDEAGRRRFARAYEAAMAELPPPTATRMLPTAFGQVRAYVWEGRRADAVPVVLHPGRGAGAPMWADNLPGLLGAGRTVVAWDALGDAGMSQQTAALRSAADQAAWVDDALDALGMAVVHVVGHSFGAATAARHAVTHPQRVASLALLEPAFTLAWPPASTFWWATVALLPGPGSWREHALAALGGVSVDEVRAASQIGDLIAAGTADFRAALPTPHPLSDAELATLRMPVYVAVAGRHSLAGGRRAARRARERLPNGAVEEWPAATHSLPMQERAGIEARLRSLWDRAEPASRGEEAA